MGKLRFCFVVHNHQPVGNFDGVFEQAYRDAYQPLLEVFDEHPNIPLAIHCSGCLLEWLEPKHPEYFDRLRSMVQRGQLEIVGGAFQEPILTMIPKRDRLGQIRTFATYLEKHFGSQPKGTWLAERVWEPSLASDLADAGSKYVILDDFHFRKAGVSPDSLFGYYVTEDEGRPLKVFPISERTRYTIPFEAPERTIEYLKAVQESHPNAVVIFADDGEKFGAWPETHKTVYEDRWLHRFLSMLQEHSSWISVTTPSRILEEIPPVGKVYLPDCSYREMTEWVLPEDRQRRFHAIMAHLDHQPSGQEIKEFLKAGYWRNFKTRYPETNEMYARVLEVSTRIERLENNTPSNQRSILDAARAALYRGQCNCAYWHGAFGGVYLPHLRNGVYASLIEADNLISGLEHGELPFTEQAIADFDADAEVEVRLANDKLAAYVAPSRGGSIYELDVRDAKINVGASLARRPEAYHDRLRRQATGESNLAGIHPGIVVADTGLADRLHFDGYLRKSLIDHFWARPPSIQEIDRAQTTEIGDFYNGTYVPHIARENDCCILTLTRAGTVMGSPVQVSKRIGLAPNSNELIIDYHIERSQYAPAVNFAIEFNIAAMPGGADDRYFLDDSLGNRLGRLDEQFVIESCKGIHLVDEWLQLQINLSTSLPARFMMTPVCTVSQCEAGFESIHQSVCVMMMWTLAEGAFSWDAAISWSNQVPIQHI